MFKKLIHYTSKVAENFIKPKDMSPFFECEISFFGFIGIVPSRDLENLVTICITYMIYFSK